MGIGLSGRDDANHFTAALLSNHMHYQQQRRVISHANHSPSDLAIRYLILFKQGQGICKHARGCFESDTMLLQIAGCFARIPIKTNTQPKCYYNNVAL